MVIWPIEHAEKARELFKLGFAAGRIADVLHDAYDATYTRSAVSGWLYRQGLTRDANEGDPRLRLHAGPHTRQPRPATGVMRPWGMPTQKRGRYSGITGAPRRCDGSPPVDPVENYAESFACTAPADTLTEVDTRKALLDVGTFECRWPVGELCCGAKVGKAYGYCATHAAIAYRAKPVRRR